MAVTKKYALFALAACIVSINAYGADSNLWLVGTWQLSENRTKPGDTDDYMDFKQDQSVALRDSKSTFATCSYSTSSNQVLLKCNVRGKEKSLSYQVSPDKKSIINPLGDVYRKNAK